MLIAELIDKQDSFEIVRDQIGAILLAETINQQALAIADAKDPDLWKLRVFTERSNPWEEWLNDDTDKSPIINVWFDSEDFDKSASNVMERQKTTGIFNIDCYGYGVATDTVGGHEPGDKNAAFESHRAVRLIRNILMSANYTYLDLRGLVWTRWIRSINSFQPQQNQNSVQQIVASRFSLEVVYNEFSPQIPPEILELIHVDVFRSETGELYMDAEYDFS
jgi:hypothetical protein